MSDAVRITLEGDRQSGLRFEEFPDAVHADLLDAIDELSSELAARIENAVPERTGKLRSEVRRRVFESEDRIKGYVDFAGKDHAKVGALEYGSKGKPTKVSAHAMKLDHFWHHRLTAPISVLVDAYSRTPTIEEHSFMRGPLAQMRSEIVSRLTAVVERAATEADR